MHTLLRLLLSFSANINWRLTRSSQRNVHSNKRRSHHPQQYIAAYTHTHTSWQRRGGKKCKTHSHIFCQTLAKLRSHSFYIQAETHLHILSWAGIKALAQRYSFNYQVLSLCLWFQFLPAKLVMIFKMPASNSNSPILPCLSFPLKCEYLSL